MGREDALAEEADEQLGTATSSAAPSQATLLISLCSWSHPTAELECQWQVPLRLSVSILKPYSQRLMLF